ncbi:hypothetical protein Clacol_000611 [Clathrus columnatus]|uniref:Uncharacterized protein n=1 Tax=Clathrus columnatus TaxID=1419009 RepID=A0AAV4ZXE7_9AGAM|nr:hypothetical protein Clacol_000611 [Clathrus columnatus]
MLPRSLSILRFQRTVITRSFTSSTIGKRSSLTAQVLDQDDFTFDGSFGEDEDLFGSTAAPNNTVDPAQDNSNSHRHMRSELFNALYVSTLATLNLRGQMSQPPRKSTVVRLTALAENKEDLRRVLEVVSAWRNVSRPPDPKTCEQFFGRCETLDHPEVALEALQNRSKYGMDIPSIATARRLLHALSRPASKITREILFNTLSFADLYPSYLLPPACKDVVSCAILASTISRSVKYLPQTEETRNDLVNAVTIGDAWKEVLLELRETAKDPLERNGVMEPKTLHRLKGRVIEIRTVLRKSEKRSEPWLKRLESRVSRELDV